MMTEPTPPTPIAPRKKPQRDPFAIRTLEQLVALFDGGDFLEQMMIDHRQLQRDLIDHLAAHGSKGCSGSMTLTINYAPGRMGDLAMAATVAFKAPKKPPSSAAAFIDDDGNLTLYSPFMARMQSPRDVTETSHDPETGEIRDI